MASHVSVMPCARYAHKESVLRTKFPMLLYLLIGVVLTGCGNAVLPVATTTTLPTQATATASATLDTPSPTAVPSMVANQMLVTMASEGGRCPYGVCRSDLVLLMDGTYSFTEGKDAAKIGTVDSADLVELTQQIQAMDFAAIKARPFSGDCPTAYDGQEWIFEFTTNGSVETLRSCQTQIDLQSAPFAVLMQLWDQMR